MNSCPRLSRRNILEYSSQKVAKLRTGLVRVQVAGRDELQVQRRALDHHFIFLCEKRWNNYLGRSGFQVDLGFVNGLQESRNSEIHRERESIIVTMVIITSVLEDQTYL